MSDDEHELRAVEQQLARAWATRDRSTIERILAREWSVTTPDGATVSRSAVLGATFDSNAQIVDCNAFTNSQSVTTCGALPEQSPEQRSVKLRIQVRAAVRA